jgi:hypothetical protein
MLSAATVAMVLGLGRQIRQIIRSQWPATSDAAATVFARHFAVAWRTSIAFALFACIVTYLLTARGIVRFPTKVGIWLRTFPDILWDVCLIIVLSSSSAHWSAKQFGKVDGQWQVGATWVAGVALAILVIPHAAFVHYLVHIATQGIDSALPHRFQRADVFPNQESDGFRLFWISQMAALAIVAAGAVQVRLNAPRRIHRIHRLILILAFVLFIAGAAEYCVWYYGTEFPLISPDLASVPTCARIVDWIGAIMIAALLLAVGAYRLSRDRDTTVVAKNCIPWQRVSPSLHESVWCLILLIGGTGLYVVETLREDVSELKSFGASLNVPMLVVDLLQDRGAYLQYAICALSLQLGWRRWRQRATALDWELSPLPPRRFFANGFALAVIVIIGMPTINAHIGE